MSTLKEIIAKNINLNKYEYNVEEVINKSLFNLTNSITNLNELIYCLAENLEEYSTRMQNDQYLQNNYNELVTCFNRIEINGKSEDHEENLENAEKGGIANCINSKSTPILIPPLIKNIKLNEKLHQQICATPLHLKNLDFQMETYTNTVSTSSTNRVNILPSTKNLTESLSKTQKILLLSSFMAAEISPRMDSLIFMNVKKVKSRIRKVHRLI
jgi:hypothetical protein